MTIHDLSLALPPRRQAQWLGIALTGLLVVAGSRVLPELGPDAGPPAAPGSISAPAPQVAGDPAAGVGTFGLAPPDERVRFWEPRVAADPNDYLSALHLADALLDRARSTADLTDLQRAEAVLATAATSAPDPILVLPRQAQVAFSLHQFSHAAALADEILTSAPNDLTSLAVSGDARLEVGDLAGAHQRYDQLNRLAPSGPVWSRLARLAFLEGNASRAVALAQRAIDDAAANGFGDETAFYRYQLGELLRATGQLDGAAAAYQSALDSLPDYPAAVVGLALTRAGQGNRSAAIELLEDAAVRLPTPEAVAALGDLYLLAGDTAAADRQYALVERIGEVGQAAGSVYDRQLVLFAADHDRAVDAAVEIAKTELAVRPDIYGFDALAWALFKVGRLDEAAAAADQARSLGTPDPRLAYHAGMIAAARGEAANARELLAAALDGAAYLPPLQVPVAEQTLAELGGAVQ